MSPQRQPLLVDQPLQQPAQHLHAPTLVRQQLAGRDELERVGGERGVALGDQVQQRREETINVVNLTGRADGHLASAFLGAPCRRIRALLGGEPVIERGTRMMPNPVGQRKSDM